MKTKFENLAKNTEKRNKAALVFARKVSADKTARPADREAANRVIATLTK